MKECIDSLGHVRFFSTLDACSFYLKILIAFNARDKTKFATHIETYMITPKLFGLKNELTTYKHAVDPIMTTVEWQFALVYLDNIIAFLRTSDHHKAHLCTVLALVETAGVQLMSPS